MRNLSNDAVEAVLSPETGLHLCWVAEINHPDFDEPFRIANTLHDISVEGDTYTGTGFSIEEPRDDEDGIRAGSITINNTDRFLTPYIRGADYRLTCQISLVSLTDGDADPPEYDEIEIAYPALAMENIRLDSTKLTANIKAEQYANESFPRDSFNRFDFRSI
jgi:hypothetical protein